MLLNSKINLFFRSLLWFGTKCHHCLNIQFSLWMFVLWEQYTAIRIDLYPVRMPASRHSLSRCNQYFSKYKVMRFKRQREENNLQRFLCKPVWERVRPSVLRLTVFVSSVELKSPMNRNLYQVWHRKRPLLISRLGHTKVILVYLFVKQTLVPHMV